MKLIPFPGSSTVPEINIETKLEVQARGMVLSFEVSGKDLGMIILPNRSLTPARKNELWKETCFECFFGVGGTSQYFEFNGSPSGDWALYAFDDYRQGMREVTLASSPVLEKLESSADRLLVVWSIPYFTQSLIQNAAITAVIKTNILAAEISYWALKHAGEKPDFHLRESFTHRFI